MARRIHRQHSHDDVAPVHPPQNLAPPRNKLTPSAIATIIRFYTMSFFASRALRSVSRCSIPTRQSVVAAANTNIRCFQASSRRAALSESDHSEHGDEDRKAKIDHHKHDQLNKQKDGKGHWKKELSSNSEAAIKADRDEIHNVDEDIAQLTKETEQAAESEKK
ncbi:MAG: hypothetical protein Q9221_008989 [Calogaya cf. arnoldii]